MMDGFGLASAGFYVWWILLNGTVYFAEFRFLQHVCVYQNNETVVLKKRRMPCYIFLNCLFTFLVMYFQVPVLWRSVLHIGMMLICFSRNMSWKTLAAPVTVIFTLSTFGEGFQTVFMKWFIQRNMTYFGGILVQMAVSGVLTFLLAMTMYFISKKFMFSSSQCAISYLYILLIPCVFIIWVIRSALGPDMQTQSAKTLFLEARSNLWVFVWMIGACAIFFIILQMFDSVLRSFIGEQEKNMLENQIREQKIYFQEAKKRNEQYRAFQHDIDNHFLVLSGLLHEKKYIEAEQYSDKLRGISAKLIVSINTGNPVADILLKEKISFAKANGIRVNAQARFPSDIMIEDMDLCILLANALDNAIHACMDVTETSPEISIQAGKRHHFLIVEVVNTTISGEHDVKYGTGLRNIRKIAKKYEGTMEIEKGQGTFRLSILLCLRNSKKISRNICHGF